jgi:hypothetical protein
MKRLGFLSVFCSVLLIGLLDACVSLQDRTMTPQERTETEVAGTVTASWKSFSFLHIPPPSGSLKNRALSELKNEAQKQGFKGNFDIRNISVSQSATPLTLALLSLNIFMDIRNNTASGDVVEYNSAIGTNQSAQRKIEGAINNAGLNLINKLPGNATVAILSVYSNDRNSSELVISELEYKFVESGKFKIVDRRRLDQIRNEQNFQMSGEVSDNSAVSIGNMLGATIVITGDISGAGSSQRLVLKALDVKSAQIITMAREQF